MNRIDLHLLLFGGGEPDVLPQNALSFFVTGIPLQDTAERKSPRSPMKCSEHESWLRNLPPYFSQ